MGIYKNKTSFALTDLIGKMYTYKITNLSDIENGLAEIISIASQIEAMGGVMDDATIDSAILK